MGVYKRGNVWWIAFQHRGHRIQKAVGRNKRLAELALADLQRKVELGETLGEPVKPATFDAFAEEYLTYSRANKSKRTVDRDLITIRRHLVPFFKKRPLSTIRPELVEAYKRERLEAVNPNTVNRELNTLKNMFRKAVEWNYLRTSPAASVRKLPEREPPIKFLSQEEITHLLDACRASRTKCLYPFVVTALNAGLRKSELFYLEWNDLDFTHRLLHVRNKEDWHTKTYENRVVPMNEVLLETLRAHPPHSRSPYVFYNADGTRFHDIRGGYENALERAGMPHATFHMLRHTFASHLVMAGVDLASVQRLLGHRDIKTTMRYAHLAPEHLSRAVNQVRLR